MAINFQDHLGLVGIVMRKYAAMYPQSYDDMFQEGCIGLLKAVKRYDPERGTTFSTYAVRCIQGEINRYLRDRHGLVKDEKRRKHKVSVFTTDDIAALRAPVLTHYDDRSWEEYELLYGAIESLPLKHQFLVSKHLQGYNFTESGQMIGLTSSQIGYAANTIKRKIRNYILEKTRHG